MRRGWTWRTSSKRRDPGTGSRTAGNDDRDFCSIDGRLEAFDPVAETRSASRRPRRPTFRNLPYRHGPTDSDTGGSDQGFHGCDLVPHGVSVSYDVSAKRTSE